MKPGGGNSLICINTSEEHREKIYIWDSEQEAEDVAAPVKRETKHLLEKFLC